MKLIKIDTGHFMCDGGALFGVIPKKMWAKQYPADDDNYCKVTMRSLLIDTGDRKILIDTGIGQKQSEKFFSYSRLFGDGELIQSLKENGYTPKDITDVLLTHLHFDHCGGCVEKTDQGDLRPTFPNATYWVSEKQWQNYLNPNIREGAVYFPENMMPVFEKGQLQTIQEDGNWLPEVEIKIYDGHTSGQIVPIVNSPQGKIAFTGDFIPVVPSVRLTWVAAYDIQPIVSIQEKEAFLQKAINENITLFFEHDFYHECCSIEETNKGIAVKERFSLEEFTSSN